MINSVKPNRNADYHRDDRQRIQERRQEGGGEAKRQREEHFRRNAEQQAREDEQQQLFHKVDTRHHKDQQQKHFEIRRQLCFDMPGAGHTDDDGFKRQQSARQKGITFQRHGQGEDKLRHQQPAGDKGIHAKNDGINDQENQQYQLIPVRRLT